jgi:hypothetical protein
MIIISSRLRPAVTPIVITVAALATVASILVPTFALAAVDDPTLHRRFRYCRELRPGAGLKLRQQVAVLRTASLRGV